MKQKLLAILCALFTVQMTAWAEEKSGYCGDPAVNGGMDVKWVLSEDSVLTISGTGEMKDYSYPKNVPWNRCINKVYIDGEVTSIGDYAFCFCSGLTSITIPNSVTSIGGSAFYCCKNLALMTVDKDNTVYDSRDNCNAIIETATNTLTMGCMNTLIPNSVTNIGEEAFCGCDSLTSIIIPNSVTSIGKNAYSWCSSLSIVTCLNPVPPMLNGSQFYRISETAVLRVPDVEAYKASDWAQYFSNIEQIDLTAIRAIEAGKKNIPTTIHDLGGRRVTEPVKGRIYIVDGKTVVW